MCVSNCLYDHTHCSRLSGCESGKDVKPNLVTGFRYREMNEELQLSYTVVHNPV